MGIFTLFSVLESKIQVLDTRILVLVEGGDRNSLDQTSGAT